MAESGGFGVTLNIGDGNVASSPTYTAVANVQEVNGFSSEQVMTEITHHASTGGYDEHIPSGMFRTDVIELVLGLDIAQATHANSSGGIVHAHLNETELAYQVVFPDSGSSTWTFDAYAQKINWLSPKDGHMQMQVTLRPTGQPTLT